MTIKEYLQNPYGKGSSFAPSQKQRMDLENQLMEMKDKFISKIYKYRDYVIFHVVIPSYKRDDVTYDVIIEVQLKNLHSGAANIEDLDFKVFSNCPSFIFTYANVFRNNNMLCEWLLSKYNPEVRKKAPIQKNRYNVVGLERSLYLAFRYLHISQRTNIAVIQTAGIKLSSRNIIINSIRTQSQIMDKVKEKVKKNPEEKTSKPGSTDSTFGSKSIKNEARVKNTKRTLFSNSTKKVKNGIKVKKTKNTKSI